MKIYFLIILFIASAGLVAAQPLGVVLGSTWFANQNNGSAGNRIAIADDGSIYICWMNVLGWPYPPAPRHVYHSWRSPDGIWNPNNSQGQVNNRSGAGCANLDIIHGNRGAIAYHNSGGTYPYYLTLSVDYNPPGLGFFDHYNPPDEIFPQTPNNPGRLYWPYVTVDRNNNIHIVATESVHLPQRLRRVGYTNSVDGGTSWSAVAVVDSVIFVTAITVSSPVSDRVAICYLHPNDTLTQVTNELFYIVSEDGLTWDWVNGKIQVTDYTGTGSNHWILSGVEAIFDNNDVLHLAWITIGDSIYWLWHYDEVSDTISMITYNPDTLTTVASINQVSLSRKMDSNPSTMLAVWCQFASGDTNVNGGYNGDLYMSNSNNSGLTWQAPVNLTNTQTPDCEHGHCMSEIYPSAAENADLLPYITYIFDPFENPYTPQTLNFWVMYFGPEHMTGIDNHYIAQPENHLIARNYPNPFNASTTISYTLPEQSLVTIEIYDILGRRIETLISQKQRTGAHSVDWYADNYPSGAYFYKITSGKSVLTQRMMLLK